MEKKILNEELKRIFEIMGVQKSNINESANPISNELESLLRMIFRDDEAVLLEKMYKGEPMGMADNVNLGVLLQDTQRMESLKNNLTARYNHYKGVDKDLADEMHSFYQLIDVETKRLHISPSSNVVVAPKDLQDFYSLTGRQMTQEEISKLTTIKNQLEKKYGKIFGAATEAELKVFKADLQQFGIELDNVIAKMQRERASLSGIKQQQLDEKIARLQNASTTIAKVGKGVLGTWKGILTVVAIVTILGFALNLCKRFESVCNAFKGGKDYLIGGDDDKKKKKKDDDDSDDSDDSDNDDSGESGYSWGGH